MSQHCQRCQRAIDLPGGTVAFCPFCGQALSATVIDDQTRPVEPAATTSAPPQQVGEYRLLRLLGRGGMGVVYEAEQQTTGRRVAIKFIDAETSPDTLERFRREGRLASTISHPRVVFVLAADEEQGRPYIVMELMPGRTLDDLVRERGPLPLNEALRHALDLIAGLEQVHRLGLIHRDVKPSNCFLDASGHIKVGDFGLARALAAGARLTRTGTFVGTPLFASPEQVKGQPLDARADVYSVCATLFFLLTGRAPHDCGDGDALGAMARVVSDDAPLLRSRRSDLPRSLERTLARGLARDRDRRWPDLAALRAALTGFQVLRPDRGFLARRFTGYLVDLALLLLLSGVFWFLFPEFVWGLEKHPWLSWGSDIAGATLYFGLCEGLWGWTPGKLLLGVRVFRADDVMPPGVWRALWRAVVCAVLLSVPILAWELMPDLPDVPDDDPLGALLVIVRVIFVHLGLPTALFAAMTTAILSTARRRNGFRCLHDVLSGTRVVPAPAGVVLLRMPPAGRGALPDDLPHRLGAFLIQDERWRRDRDRVLGGLDPSFDRPVWVWLRPADRPALPEPRRELFRAPACAGWLTANRMASAGMPSWSPPPRRCRRWCGTMGR
jgi:hypothetical protein